MPDEKIMGMLKGPRGSIVKIKILRSGQKDLLPFEIKRDKIPIFSVDVAYMVNDHIGYIKVNAFAMTTFDEFIKGLRELKSHGMTGLILDLRGNSGGIMEAAIQLADQFLKEGQLIVYTKGRASPRSEARATGKGEFETGQLVVLIDEWSASASEILAGALQDNDRGTIIGRRSFGKGLVQEPIPFSDGSEIRLTIARYYTPTGRSIQKPYKDGYDKYYDDISNRYTHGEFQVSDSIHFSDSLKFTTAAGKIVYGGGGIMPDKFVPVDTSGVSPYFVKARSFIYRFALNYTEKNRDALNKYTTPADLKKYLDKQGLLEKFIQFAADNKIKRDPAGLKISGDIIHTQLEAYVARNILDNQGFYPIWENIDTTLKYAINFLKD
jgi:carboxyl-terminal processing protease